MAAIIYLSLMIAELFVLLGVSLYGLSLLFSAFKGAPYVPTSKKQLERILDHAHLRKNAQFTELGSGDGRMVRYAVNRYGVVGMGVEINPLLVWWSRYLAKRDGILDSVSFQKLNIFDYPLRDTDFLYLFLMPQLLDKLMPKFKRELKKGMIIISHGFKLTGYEKKLIHTEFDKTFSTFYYKI